MALSSQPGVVGKNRESLARLCRAVVPTKILRRSPRGSLRGVIISRCERAILSLLPLGPRHQAAEKRCLVAWRQGDDVGGRGEPGSALAQQLDPLL
jgi:hypothetical protein